MKKRKIGITGYNADDLRAELSEATTFASLLANIGRDMRSMWLAEDSCLVIDAAKSAAPWLRGEPKAAIPEPMLSTVLRPGGDADRKSEHRNLAFARAYMNGGPLDTYPLQLMQALEWMMTDELQKVVDHPLVAELRQQIDERYIYMARALDNHYEEETVRKTLTEKAQRLGQAREELSRVVADMERERLGCEIATPELRRIGDGIDAVAGDVKTLRRTSKCPPASSTAQQWVLDRVAYFCLHPESLAGNVTRRRVYIRDVWGTDCEQAIAQYHLEDYDAYKRCYVAAKKMQSRMKG